MMHESTAEAAALDLLVQAGQGSISAFAALYDRFAPAIHAIAAALHADPSSAEHATEAAFLTIWRTAPRYDPSRMDPTRWLFTTACQAMTRQNIELRSCGTGSVRSRSNATV